MIRRSWIGLGILLAAAPALADDPPRVDFGRDVRPILADRCFSCHGAEKQKSGLRLDRKADALAGGDSGLAIAPGKSAESLLARYVSGEDAENIMPPRGDRLSNPQVRTLKRWIDEGAAWPEESDAPAKPPGSDHWAFRPPRRPPVPQVKDKAWVRNPIDAFLLARLEKEGVAPSPEADRTTLIRRLSLDLTGLPPAIAEVDAFLDDRSDVAYEKLVDRLLASPHFGERWGRHWLDLARYADSDGYEKDSARPFAWRYRNWVIDALNRDLPYDRFTVEQLAGDLLPGATAEQKVATGFHRNTLTNREGGVDREEYRVASVVDRVNTTGSVWLGLTVGCAQCHTHKYDPIKHKEYYGLFAFFNSADEDDIPAPLPGEEAAYLAARSAFDADHARLAADLKAYEDGPGAARRAEWQASFASTPPPRWQVLEPEARTSRSGAELTVKPDGSVLVAGTHAEADSYTLVVHTDLPRITALRVEALDDPALPSKGPGRTAHGNFVLTELRVRADPACGDDGPSVAVKLRNASHDFAQDQFPASAAIDGDPKTGWAVSPRMGRGHAAVFETETDVGFPCGTKLTIVVDQDYGTGHTIGRLRVSAVAAPRPIKAGDYPDDIPDLLAIAPAKRSREQAARLVEHARSLDPDWKRLNDAVQAHRSRAPAPPATKAQAMAESPQPRTTNVHIRGDFLRKGEEVRPHTPAVLPPLEKAGGTPNRLDLARWLVDRNHPLTARVAVNRTWRHLFGRAMVVTADDFGTRGDPPSHPDLLDWLAVEFMDRGWSQKGMIRLIVTSSAYRQSSKGRDDLAERDPNNLWIARQSRFRPEAEVVRDLALAACGLLNPEIGGPGVFPPQPPGISELTYAGGARWVESRGKDRYRRGMYTFFRRTSPYPMLMTFDSPDSNVCASRRERSNTPLQALTLLNDAVFVECAQALARRVLAETPSASDRDRIRHAFRLGLARPPGDREVEVLGGLLAAAREAARADPASAARLAGSKPPLNLDAAEVAAWVALARTILNLDEFVTRE